MKGVIYMSFSVIFYGTILGCMFLSAFVCGYIEYRRMKKQQRQAKDDFYRIFNENDRNK